MLKPALGRCEDAESFNPRKDGPLIAGDSSEAGALGRLLTTGAIGGGVAAGAGGGTGLAARCGETGGWLSEADTSVAPHMLQKRFVA